MEIIRSRRVAFLAASAAETPAGGVCVSAQSKDGKSDGGGARNPLFQRSLVPSHKHATTLSFQNGRGRQPRSVQSQEEHSNSASPGGVEVEMRPMTTPTSTEHA